MIARLTKKLKKIKKLSVAGLNGTNEKGRVSEENIRAIGDNLHSL